MQSQKQTIHPSWSYYKVGTSVDESFLYELDMDLQMGDCEISSTVTATHDSIDISSIPYFSTDELLDFHSCGHDIQATSPFNQSFNLQEFCCTSNEPLVVSNEMEDATQWTEEKSISNSEQWSYQQSEATLSSSVNMYMPEPSLSIHPSLVLPRENNEFDNQIIIPHLLKAYGEAIGNEERELADVIMKRTREKVSPYGASFERLAYYLFNTLDNQGEYLKEEASKNYEAAFKAFYEIFPYGRFAHFTANLAILEAIPKSTDVIHIIDFDLCDGSQWPPFIEAIGKQRSIRLTSVKWKDDDADLVLSQWRFEDTQRHLYDHAYSLGLNLEVDEMDMEAITNMKTIGIGKEWLAFNCMLGLPHTGTSRSARKVTEFVSLANELTGKSSNTGIVALGNGEVMNGKAGNCSSFGSFFEEHLVHFNAMFESIDWHLPSNLTEAKMAMECLFVAPAVSSNACFQKWKTTREGCGKLAIGQKGLTFSRENMMQANEMVREGEGLYEVVVEGDNENEMVLKWMGTPLVRVSTWI